MKPKLTVIVCTYNRAYIIEETLPTLFNQDVNLEEFDVIIVNNNSNDNTSGILEKLKSRYTNLIVIDEKNQGLSYAKNAGMLASLTDWLVYLDDDAKVPIDFIRKAINNIDKAKFSCFGGVYLPWYKYGKPKWYKDIYASNRDKLSEFGILEKDFISGGIMAIKKNLLLKYDGFSTEIGMKGNKIAYGEETLLQINLRSDGYDIGYDPNWVMYHLVSEYKLSPWWFVRSGYASGKDSWNIYQVHPSFSKILVYSFRTLKMFILNFFKYSVKLFKSNYYIQNWIVDVFRPSVLKIGQINGAIKILISK